MIKDKKANSILRILLHGFFLVSLNLFSIMAAFVFVQISPIQSDRLIQGSVALLINVIIYFVVYRLMREVQEEIMRIEDFTMLAIILLTSLALLPAIFYPLHYLTQGYWSSLDNLISTWPFQLLVNGLCLVMNYFIFYRRKK